MGRKHDGIPAFDGEDHLAGRGQTGIGGRHQGSNHAHRFGIFHDAFFRDFFDDPDAGIAQAVSQDQFDFVPFVPFADFIPQTGFIHRFIADRTPHLHIADGCGYGLAQPIHTGLVIGFDDLLGSFCPGDLFLHHFDFFRGCFSRCHSNLSFSIFIGFVSFLLLFRVY